MPVMIDYRERDLTEHELQRVHTGFDEHQTVAGSPPVPMERTTFVALDGDRFVGCSSAITYDTRRWAFLTDLYVEKGDRGRGHGIRLLQLLETRLVERGTAWIWTWTAGFEAPGFYAKCGYTEFCAMDGWYATGHARIGFKKPLP